MFGKTEAGLDTQVVSQSSKYSYSGFKSLRNMILFLTVWVGSGLAIADFRLGRSEHLFESLNTQDQKGGLRGYYLIFAVGGPVLGGVFLLKDWLNGYF